MKNSKSARSFQNSGFSSRPPPRFYDPYTGGSRYIPGATNSSPAASAAPQNSAAVESPQASTSKTSLTSVCIPLTNYLKIENGNLDLMKGNLIFFYFLSQFMSKNYENLRILNNFSETTRVQFQR